MPRISFKSYIASLDAEKLSKLKYIEDGRYHYVYRITNIVEGKHYYGSRTSDVHPSLDLGTEYFTSATSNSWIIEDQKYNQQNYTYKIIRSDFKTRADATIYESYLHSIFDVKNHKRFYNGSNQTPYGFDTTGVSKNNSGKNNPMFGKNHTEDTKFRISNAQLGEKNHMYGKVGHNKGRKYSDEVRSKVSKMTKIAMSKIKFIHPVTIYDADGNIVIKIDNRFRQICKDLGYPAHYLEKEYKNTGNYSSKIFIDDTSSSKSSIHRRPDGWEKFIGWRIERHGRIRIQ